MNMIDVVAGVINKSNKYLIAKRIRFKHFAYHWEFPGGKVDKDETFGNALKREIFEELSLKIKILKHITSKKYHDKKINVHLHYYLCEPLSSRIKLSEHEAMRWVLKNDFIDYKLAPGDAKVIKYLD